MNSLIGAGVNKNQAEIMAKGMEMFSESNRSEFITKHEFYGGLNKLENALIKWIIGSCMALTILTFTVMEFRISSIETLIGQNGEAIRQNTEAIHQNREAIQQNREAIQQNREAIQQVQVSIQKLIDLHLQQAQNK